MTTTPTAAEPSRLLSARAVASMLSVSTRTVWRMTASGELPQPKRYNRKLVRWSRSAIVAYVERLDAEAQALQLMAEA
jgi:excisionase family DNA binding protein